MKAGAEADRRQNAETDPVRIPYELLVEHGNELHRTPTERSMTLNNPLQHTQAVAAVFKAKLT